MSHVDLHVVLLLLLLLPLGGCGAYDLAWSIPVGVMFVVPQGIVLTRTFADLRPHAKPWLAYLVQNEIVILAAASLQYALTR